MVEASIVAILTGKDKVVLRWLNIFGENDIKANDLYECMYPLGSEWGHNRIGTVYVGNYYTWECIFLYF